MLASLKRVVGLLLVSTLVLPLGATASQIVNGDFEAGNFGGWKLFNYGATLVTSNTAWLQVTQPLYDWQGVQENHSAAVIAMSGWNVALPGWSCARDIWNVACPEPDFRYTGDGTPLTYPPLPVFRFSGIIGQDVTVRVGDTLTWDWACITQLDCNDFDGDQGTFFATNGESFFFFRTIATQLEPATFVFPFDGVWSIYFGQNQRSDNWFWSGLVLDNVVLHETPEPGTLVLICLGVAALAFTRRRKH